MHLSNAGVLMASRDCGNASTLKIDLPLIHHCILLWFHGLLPMIHRTDAGLNENFVLYRRQLTFIPIVRFLAVPFSPQQRISCLINHNILHMAGADLWNSSEKWRCGYMKANVLDTSPWPHAKATPNQSTQFWLFEIVHVCLYSRKKPI